MITEPVSSLPVADVDIAILGAGFSGSLLAVHLSAADLGPSIALIDRSRSPGTGLAYGAAGARHLLNVPAGRMGAFPDQPGHFLEWVRERAEERSAFGLGEVGEGDFLPRRLYGRYLSDQVMSRVRESRRLRLLDRTVKDLTRAESGVWRLVFEDGSTLDARAVVLATGNFPSTRPAAIPPELEEAGAYFNSPWSAAAVGRLAGSGDVLVLGTGLTALDLLATLQEAKPAGVIHLLSRRGLPPQKHAPGQPRAVSWEPLPLTVREALHRVRGEIRRAVEESGGWRPVIDSLRPVTAAIWGKWSLAERRRFLRHVRPYWEVARHRAAPLAYGVLEDLLSGGRAKLHKGRIQRIVANGEGVAVTFRPRDCSPEVTLNVAAVVNCTGPEADLRRVRDSLVTSLIDRELVSPDPLGLGVEVTMDGAVIDAGAVPATDFFALGGLRKGLLWESTAVPELRAQAAALARLLLERWVPGPLRPEAGVVEPGAGFIWAYEI